MIDQTELLASFRNVIDYGGLSEQTLNKLALNQSIILRQQAEIAAQRKEISHD